MEFITDDFAHGYLVNVISNIDVCDQDLAESHSGVDQDFFEVIEASLQFSPLKRSSTGQLMSKPVFKQYHHKGKKPVVSPSEVRLDLDFQTYYPEYDEHTSLMMRINDCVSEIQNSDFNINMVASEWCEL